ncbi:WD40-repeat-containing domain protein [Gorgonomyces haynaldii]|nr:WD40-repeat-containing domain protein [Gorgonomyces haynaldii]
MSLDPPVLEHVNKQAVVGIGMIQWNTAFISKDHMPVLGLVLGGCVSCELFCEGSTRECDCKDSILCECLFRCLEDDLVQMLGQFLDVCFHLNSLCHEKFAHLQMVSATTAVNNFDTKHEDMIHDAQLDYYGKRLATCSSDRTVKIFNVEGSSHQLMASLTGHEGPVWQVAWAHPKFGSILASCSFDSKVFVWKENNGQWNKIKDHILHTASVNSIQWAPHEYGLALLCGSSDGKISILTYKDDGNWDVNQFNAHSIGTNSVSWAPSLVPGSLVQTTSGQQTKRFASGGCDNLVKIFREENGSWKEESVLEGHSDWVRDVAFAPSIGLPRLTLASCSQDRTVIIWTQEDPKGPWNKRLLKQDPFPDVLWRVSWSTAGNILAVSCGDNKITLWKENVDGEFAQIGDVNES